MAENRPAELRAVAGNSFRQQLRSFWLDASCPTSERSLDQTPGSDLRSVCPVRPENVRSWPHTAYKEAGFSLVNMYLSFLLLTGCSLSKLRLVVQVTAEMCWSRQGAKARRQPDGINPTGRRISWLSSSALQSEDESLLVGQKKQTRDFTGDSGKFCSAGFTVK